jgi:archaellum component FlaC
MKILEKFKVHGGRLVWADVEVVSSKSNSDQPEYPKLSQKSFEHLIDTVNELVNGHNQLVTEIKVLKSEVDGLNRDLATLENMITEGKSADSLLKKMKDIRQTSHEIFEYVGNKALD